MCKAETKTPPKPSTTPSNSQSGGSAQNCCHPACTISSETVATSPADRTRTKIGVGEEVNLKIKGNPATWAITSGGGTLSPNTGARTSVKFTADDNAGSVTVTATGSGCSCVNTITFNVVQPSHWIMKRVAGTNLKHTNGRPDCGWKASMFIQPKDVNFYRIQIRELDSQAVCTGSYMPFNGIKHGNYPPPDNASPWLSAGTHTAADGTKMNSVDNIYSGDPGAGATNATPPFKVGTMYFPITFQWRVLGKTTNHNFPVVRQEHEIHANGKCDSNKGGNAESSMHTDPTSTP